MNWHWYWHSANIWWLLLLLMLLLWTTNNATTRIFVRLRTTTLRLWTTALLLWTAALLLLTALFTTALLLLTTLLLATTLLATALRRTTLFFLYVIIVDTARAFLHALCPFLCLGTTATQERARTTAYHDRIIMEIVWFRKYYIDTRIWIKVFFFTIYQSDLCVLYFYIKKKL